MWGGSSGGGGGGLGGWRVREGEGAGDVAGVRAEVEDVGK